MNEPLREESGARAIVREAVVKLRERRGKVEPMVARVKAELDETSRFIKLFERALGGTAAPTPKRTLPTRTPGMSPRARFTARVIALVADEPRSVESIANQFGSSLQFVENVVAKAVEAGARAFDETGAVKVP